MPKATKKKRTKKKTVTKRSNRDEQGRFRKGCPGGPGNPNVHRLAEYRQTINKAVTPEDLAAVMKKIVAKAKAGDMLAAKELLDRTVGKASTARNAGEAADLELPRLATTKDTVAAANAVLKALNDGRLSPDGASQMFQVVELARRSLETHELAEQVAELRERYERNTR